MRELCKRAKGAALIVMLLALPAWCQLQVGENTSLNLNANVSIGYTADYSNLAGSDHSLNPSGNADLTGFYYNPNFLSFDIQPFFNQSRLNSTYQSVFQSTGVNANASIFSGSAFPGSVSFSKVYNGEGGYTIPGVGNLTTHGNSQNLGIAWGIHLPDLPVVSLQFTDGDSSNSVFGASSDSLTHLRMFGANASYIWNGFNLNGGYHYSTSHAVTPEFLAVGPAEESDSSSNSFDFSAGHKLPFHGAFDSSFSRSDINSSFSGDKFNGTIYTAGGGADFEPISNLNVGTNAQYTNNLEGTIYQSAIVSGAVLPSSFLNYATSSLDVNSHVNYLIPKAHLTFGFIEDHRDQMIAGGSYSADVLNEMVNYSNEFLGGYLNTTATLTQTSVSLADSSSSIGEYYVISYQRRLGGWNLNGAYNQTRNTQTILIGYTTSGHGYSLGIGHKINAYTYWGASAVESKSVFNNQPGTNSSSQSYSTSLTLKRFSLNGSYAKADGISILTPTGLVSITNPIPISPLQSVVFNGKSYSFGASTDPRRGLILSANYSTSRSNTLSASAGSENSTALLNGMLQYKVRQLWIVGGYLRIQQGFSITGQPPMSDSSFYIGITRWFKFF